MYKVDGLSDDNVTRCAKEIIQLMDERERAAAARAKEEEEQQSLPSLPPPQQQQEEQEKPQIELTPELTRELTYEEISVIVSLLGMTQEK